MAPAAQSARRGIGAVAIAVITGLAWRSKSGHRKHGMPHPPAQREQGDYHRVLPTRPGINGAQQRVQPETGYQECGIPRLGSSPIVLRLKMPKTRCAVTGNNCIGAFITPKSRALFRSGRDFLNINLPISRRYVVSDRTFIV